MNGILIACPMGREAKALHKHLGGGLEVLATGLGMRRTLPVLLRRFRMNKPSLLLFTGSASQLDLELQMKDIVLAETWCLEDGPCFCSDEPLIEGLRRRGWKISEKGLTVSRPVLKAEQREALFRSSGACIFDTVTATVLRVAKTAGVPCLAPKIVAGTAKSGLMTFWNQLDRNIEPLALYLKRLVAAIEGLGDISGPRAR